MEPKDHTENRGWVESILRYVPGFRGYLEKEYRRESDQLQRKELVNQLQRSKRGLDAVGQRLVAAGQLDALMPIESLRKRMDHLISRIDGATQGYSGFFDLVQIDEKLLADLYEYDRSLLTEVHELANDLETLAQTTFPSEVPAAVGVAAGRVDHLHKLWDGREDLQAGLA